MAKNVDTVRFMDSELAAKQAAGESKSDWKSAGALTETHIEAAVASDPEEAGMLVDWSQVSAELPKPKSVLNIRVDSDVLDFFRSLGKGYQTRINAVLRSYVDQVHHR